MASTIRAKAQIKIAVIDAELEAMEERRQDLLELRKLLAVLAASERLAEIVDQDMDAV